QEFEQPYEQEYEQPEEWEQPYEEQFDSYDDLDGAAVVEAYQQELEQQELAQEAYEEWLDEPVSEGSFLTRRDSAQMASTLGQELRDQVGPIAADLARAQHLDDAREQALAAHERGEQEASLARGEEQLVGILDDWLGAERFSPTSDPKAYPIMRQAL